MLGEITKDADGLLYSVLSLISGNGLRKIEKQKLRQIRQSFETNGVVPRRDELLVIIDAGMKEANLSDSFDPNLLVVSTTVYKILFGIPAGICVFSNPKWSNGGRQKVEITHRPPETLTCDAGDIQVTCISGLDKMLLVESTAFSQSKDFYDGSPYIEP